MNDAAATFIVTVAAERLRQCPCPVCTDTETPCPTLDHDAGNYSEVYLWHERQRQAQRQHDHAAHVGTWLRRERPELAGFTTAELQVELGNRYRRMRGED